MNTQFVLNTETLLVVLYFLETIHKLFINKKKYTKEMLKLISFNILLIKYIIWKIILTLN